ncbi:MAG: hypothetical protein ABIS36_07635 [Chryseolinea sp.]
MKFKTQLFISAIALISTTSFAQPAKISPNDWSVFSENNDAATLKDTVFLGKSCVKLDGKKQAIAIRKGSNYKNFMVEVDIAARVMSGIGFHVADNQNYQFLYFRPGYGGTQEAIQYIPIFNGALSWVLYNYPAYEKTADIKAMEWFHASLEVRGSIMKVYVNHSKAPQMEIHLIDTDSKQGAIMIRTMFGESYYANMMMHELPAELTDWEISEQFPRKETLDLDPAAKSSSWTPVKADDASIVNIAKYIKNPNGVVIAKTTLKADADKDGLLYFDFIGKLKVYLNGKELYYYEKAKLDRIFRGTETLILHLKKGDNELAFVTEGDATIFGKGFNAMGRAQHQNWGFIAELGNTR